MAQASDPGPATEAGAVPGGHGPGHVGCTTCDPLGGQAPANGAGRPRLSTVKVRARGEDFRIVRLQGQLVVCTRQNGSCCCGWEEKGRMPFDPDTLWGQEWERRKIRNQVHLTFSGCLGPCAAGNNALLHLFGRAIWLKDLNDPTLAGRVFDWVETMLAAGRVLPPPENLREHVYERFLPPPSAEGQDGDPLAGALDGAADDGTGLERLDPVCLMDVDPATARHRVEYEGRTIVFCAPSCKKQFLADPAAYLAA